MPRTLGQAIGFLLGLLLAIWLSPFGVNAENRAPAAELEADLHGRVLAIRSQEHLIPLIRRADLDRIARSHAAEIRDLYAKHERLGHRQYRCNKGRAKQMAEHQQESADEDKLCRDLAPAIANIDADSVAELAAFSKELRGIVELRKGNNRKLKQRRARLQQLNGQNQNDCRFATSLAYGAPLPSSTWRCRRTSRRGRAPRTGNRPPVKPAWRPGASTKGICLG